MKTLGYETKVDSRAELRVRIFAVAEQIRNHPDRIVSAIQTLLIRAENCLANGGGHFDSYSKADTVVQVYHNNIM